MDPPPPPAHLPPSRTHPLPLVAPRLAEPAEKVGNRHFWAVEPPLTRGTRALIDNPAVERSEGATHRSEVPLWGLAHLIIRQPWNSCLTLSIRYLATAKQPFHGCSRRSGSPFPTEQLHFGRYAPFATRHCGVIDESTRSPRDIMIIYRLFQWVRLVAAYRTCDHANIFRSASHAYPGTRCVCAANNFARQSTLSRKVYSGA